MIWFNVRREPVAYAGGLPVAPRLPGAPHKNIEVPLKDIEGAQVGLMIAREPYTVPASGRLRESCAGQGGGGHGGGAHGQGDS